MPQSSKPQSPETQKLKNMKKDYITLKDGRLTAPRSAHFAKKLQGDGWLSIGNTLRTVDFKNALNHIEHFHPELQRALAEQLTAGQKDKLYQPVVPEGITLEQYQKEDVAHIIRKKSTLLYEEAGLGKTVICIAAMNDLKPKNTLIICPATLKYNWTAEYRTFSTTQDVNILIVEGSIKPELGERNVVVINFDVLGRHLDWLYELTWDMLIVDEAHRLAYETANRTAYVLGGKTTSGHNVQGIRANKEVFATATPMNRPIQLWPIIRHVDPHGIGRDYNHYVRRYCGARDTRFGQDVRGSSNMGELGVMLRSTCMVRHFEVLDLPPLIEEIILFDPGIVETKEQDLFKQNLDLLRSLAAEQEITMSQEPTTEEIRSLIGHTFLEAGRVLRMPKYAPLFHDLATARKELGIAKIPLMIRHIRQQLENYDSVAFFAYHTDVLKAVYEDFKEDATIIRGGMTARAKQEAKDAFQNGKSKVFVGQISAAGEGITLTRSQKQVIGELDWNYTAMTQVIKRLHRFGQKRPVYVDYLIVDGTLDSQTGRAIIRKGAAVNTLFCEGKHGGS